MFITRTLFQFHSTKYIIGTMGTKSMSQARIFLTNFNVFNGNFYSNIASNSKVLNLFFDITRLKKI